MIIANTQKDNPFKNLCILQFQVSFDGVFIRT